MKAYKQIKRETFLKTFPEGNGERKVNELRKETVLSRLEVLREAGKDEL